MSMNENDILAAIADLPSLSPGFLDSLEKTLNDTFFEHYDSKVVIELQDYQD